ncbi:MAG: PIN domain-containing protein [Candidatus Woesearchaeota archaeon]
MKVVVDTNVLMTFFWQNSVFRKLLTQELVDCIAPEYALEEINKYEAEICKKTNITKKQYKEQLNELAIYVEFISIENYQEKLIAVVNNMPDPKDIDFVALAVKHELPLWTNDKLLKEQSVVAIYTTKEILDELKKRQDLD